MYYILGAYVNRDENTGAWSWDPFEWNDPIFSSAGFNDAAYWNGYEQAYGDVYGWDSSSYWDKSEDYYYFYHNGSNSTFFDWGYQEHEEGGMGDPPLFSYVGDQSKYPGAIMLETSLIDGGAVTLPPFVFIEPGYGKNINIKRPIFNC